MINLRYIKGKPKEKEVEDLQTADQLVRDGKLPDYQANLYWIMRYTGAHVSEAAGIRFEDIDLENECLHIRDNEMRPLKTSYRPRVIPAIPELLAVLKKVKIRETGHVFPGLYNERYQRWGNGMSWHRTIGHSPKACRDSVATELRDADVNERTLGAILGHTPKTSTGRYGAVSQEAKLAALMHLSQS